MSEGTPPQPGPWQVPAPAQQPPHPPQWGAPAQPGGWDQPQQQPPGWDQPPQQPGWGGAPQQPGWGGAPPWATPPKRDGMAVAALIFGILPICGGLLGIGFGIGALSRIKRSGAQGRRMAIAGIVLGGLWLLGLLAAGLVSALEEARRDGTGGVSVGGRVALADVRVGDCLAEMPDEGTILTVKLTPCGDPHAGEVYYIFDLPPGRFPGDAAVERTTEGECLEQLHRYVNGTPGETGYDVFFLMPQRASWSQPGGREATCILEADNGDKLIDSVRGRGDRAK